MLKALLSYYEKLAEQGKLPKPGRSLANVSYALMLDKEGAVTGVMPLMEEVERGKKKIWIPKQMIVPEQVSRSSGISSNFLCDNAAYFLGISSGKGQGNDTGNNMSEEVQSISQINNNRTIDCFINARKKHLEILHNAKGGAANAVKNFFMNWQPENASSCGALKEYYEEIIGVNLVFWFNGRYVHEDEEVMEIWTSYYTNQIVNETGVCLVTGKIGEIARTHTGIRGIAGAQSSGAMLISFNESAFSSYGKEQGYNAPVSKHAMYGYTNALQYLVRDSKHRKYIGDTLIVYWSESGGEQYQDAFFACMEPEQDNGEVLDGLFSSLEKGISIDPNVLEEGINYNEHFYILGIVPNAARLSVRFFHSDSFGNIVKNIKAHYDRLDIDGPPWEKTGCMGIWRLLNETVNKKSSETHIPGLAAGMFKAVLSDGRYPEALFNSVLRRIRADTDEKDKKTSKGETVKKITSGRAAIIKAYLIKNYKEDITVELNENNTNVAYVLGREFAVLENIQERANPGINATIKDRYFNSACSTPSGIFPILFKLKNSHVRKLDDMLATYFEKQLSELQSKIIVGDTQMNAYPKRLNLEQQGMFILGYYHQRQKRFEKKNVEEK